MMKPLRFLLLFAVMGFATGSASAANVFNQAPCVPGPDCGTLLVGGPDPRTVRSYVFNAPRAGHAEVHFTGSLVCTSDESQGKTVAFDTQITGGITAPVIGSPSALRHSGFLPAVSGSTLTFNLASSRAIQVAAAGPVRIFFMLGVNEIDSDMSCAFYNNAFNVVFTP